MANKVMRKWLITLRPRTFDASFQHEYTYVLNAERLTEEAVNKVRKEYTYQFTSGGLSYLDVVVVNITPLEG